MYEFFSTYTIHFDETIAIFKHLVMDITAITYICVAWPEYYLLLNRYLKLESCAARVVPDLNLKIQSEINSKKLFSLTQNPK